MTVMQPGLESTAIMCAKLSILRTQKGMSTIIILCFWGKKNELIKHALIVFLFFCMMCSFYCQVCVTIFIKFRGCLVFSSIMTVQFT